MGFFRATGKVYKPAPEVNLGAASDEFYIHPEVKAPRVAGLLVKIFVWILESWIIGPIVLYFLKKDNLIHKLVSFADIPEPPVFTSANNWEDIPEQNVSPTKPELTPIQRVREALNCLPASLNSMLNGDLPLGFKRWTIRDFHRAYATGEATPLIVFNASLLVLFLTINFYWNAAIFIFWYWYWYWYRYMIHAESGWVRKRCISILHILFM